MAEAEMNFCNNCKKQISASNFMMHEVHCKRHIALCEHCSEPIPRGEMDVHFEENHAKIACPKCGVEVEKMNLEDHEENSCQKKPMECVYCQLVFPKNEFEAHGDYCGSRTEQCPKCGQYVKLKDQAKHEDTKCRYPEIKPSNTNRPDPGGPLNGHGNEYLSGLPGLNPFAFEELSRVMGMPEMSRPEMGRQEMGRPEIGRDRAPGAQGSGGLEPNKRTTRQNVSVKRATKTSMKSDVNRQRGQPSSQRGAPGRRAQPQLQARGTQGRRGSSPGGENDYDHLLAMHLAQDLNPEEDLDALMSQFGKPRSPVSPTIPIETTGRDRNTYSEDMVMIPCEFCGEPYTADDLVQHQSGCSLERISDVLPTLLSGTNRTDAVNNTGGRGGARSPVVDPPAILDNLRNFNAEPWLGDSTGYPVENGDDGDLLPCEFCDEQFPMDTLVQHQAICDSNTTVTPRVMTPADTQVRRPKPRRQQRTPAAQGLESDFPNLSSRRHQPTPEIELDLSGDENERGDDASVRPKKYTIGATHRVRKPNTTAASNMNSDDLNIDYISKALRKYEAESQDRGENSRGSSRRSASNDSDSWLQPDARAYKSKPSVGASRARNTTIDSLLNESEQGSSSSHDLLGHIGASNRKQPTLKPVTRKIPSQPTMGVTTRTTKPRTTTRDVQPDPVRTTTGTSQAKNRTSRPNFEVRVRPAEADETSNMVGSQRPSRANHVFGASSNTTTRTSKR